MSSSGGGRRPPGRRQGRRFTAATISSSTRRLRLPHPQVRPPCTSTRRSRGSTAKRSAASCGLQVVVVLGDERDDRRRCGVPPARLLVAGAMQGRGEQHGTRDAVLEATSRVRCRTTSPPAMGSAIRARPRTPWPPRHPPVRRRPRRTSHRSDRAARSYPAGVEPQHGEVGHGGQSAAALRVCESMKPPAVGNGCSVTSVATGGRSTGVASSPTSRSPSVVCSSISSRFAGARRPLGPRLGTRRTDSPDADPPTVGVVSPRCEVGRVAEHAVGAPGDEVGDAGRDLEAAARAG